MFRDDVISGAESRLRQWRTSEGFISLISWRSALQHQNLQFRTASFVHADLPFIFLTSAERLRGERGGLTDDPDRADGADWSRERFTLVYRWCLRRDVMASVTVSDFGHVVSPPSGRTGPSQVHTDAFISHCGARSCFCWWAGLGRLSATLQVLGSNPSLDRHCL